MDRVVPVLPTDDLATARTYYVDGLGFAVTWEVTDDGHTGLLGIARGDMHITLDCPMDGHGRQACVSFHVDDVDSYFAEWSAKVPAPPEPRDEEWGSRTFSLHDPSGNTLFVIGPPRGPAAAQA